MQLPESIKCLCMKVSLSLASTAPKRKSTETFVSTHVTSIAPGGNNLNIL